jgi:hypothetical protein
MPPPKNRRPRRAGEHRTGKAGSRKKNIDQTSSNGKDIVMTGKDQNGKTVYLRRGDLARMNVLHDSWCPLLNGGKVCRCNPDTYLEIIARGGSL